MVWGVSATEMSPAIGVGVVGVGSPASEPPKLTMTANAAIAVMIRMSVPHVVDDVDLSVHVLPVSREIVITASVVIAHDDGQAAQVDQQQEDDPAQP